MSLCDVSIVYVQVINAIESPGFQSKTSTDHQPGERDFSPFSPYYVPENKSVWVSSLGSPLMQCQNEHISSKIHSLNLHGSAWGVVKQGMVAPGLIPGRAFQHPAGTLRAGLDPPGAVMKPEEETDVVALTAEV